MNQLLIDENKIGNMIYEIRGQQVMLDSDLAKLYQCINGTKTINLAVKRHIDRFPSDFYFQLTLEETMSCSKFQIETLNTNGRKRGTNIKKLPYAFTEQGVAMLATVLRTSVASEVSIKIMRAFVTMRRYISTNLIEQKYINGLVLKDNKRIDLLEEVFSKFEKKKIINEIYFNGQIYDAYSKITNIMKEARKNLIIVDSYADKTVLDMISNISVKTILITKKKGTIKKLDIEKYNQQYNNLIIINDDTFHDRYIIIDKKIVYHCGTSLNHAGNKTFSINLLEDTMVIESILGKIIELENKYYNDITLF